MKNKTPFLQKEHIYDAPVLYAGLFYLLLAAWTVVSIYLLGTKALKAGGWPMSQLLMIVFVLAYTWYFSLAIAYKIAVHPDGRVVLTSVRRTLDIPAENISMLEGPRLTILPFGFIRLRLAREKAYLFIMITDEPLHRVLAALHRSNPEMKFKGLPQY